MIGIETISAGGGGIAYIDQGGIFRIGPKLAGVNLGSIDYSRGGEEQQ